MKKSTLLLTNVRLKPSQIHKFRGFIGNLFKNYDLIHNHDLKTGKPIYRYPLIQFKLIENTPAIIAVTERAVEIFSEIFMTLERIVIDNEELIVFEKDLNIEDVEFGFTREKILYEILTPWIGLNRKNYKRYMKAADSMEKNGILQGVMIGNMLSMSKYLDHWLDAEEKITAELEVKQCRAVLKGEPMLGFTGSFKANFMIPDYLGLGKSVSRGYGMVKRALK